METKLKVASITRRASGWSGEELVDLVMEGRLDDLSRMGKVSVQITGLRPSEVRGFNPGFICDMRLTSTGQKLQCHDPANGVMSEQALH